MMCVHSSCGGLECDGVGKGLYCGVNMHSSSDFINNGKVKPVNVKLYGMTLTSVDGRLKNAVCGFQRGSGILEIDAGIRAIVKESDPKLRFVGTRKVNDTTIGFLAVSDAHSDEPTLQAAYDKWVTLDVE